MQLYRTGITHVDRPTREDYFHVWHLGLEHFSWYADAGFPVTLDEAKAHDEASRHELRLRDSGIVPICVKSNRKV